MTSLCVIRTLEAKYTDHRGHNVDSLEQVVAGWTPEKEASATQEESEGLVKAYYELMHAYRPVNGRRSQYFARKLTRLSRRWNWLNMEATGDEGEGIIYYGEGQYDSALVCYNRALAVVDRMAAGEVSGTSGEVYDERSIYDDYSSLYGAIGNLYNMMDSIDTAMRYYAKAGEIFDRFGWNESNSILYYNIGETWMDEGDLRKALPAYEKALSYADAAGDSLLMANATKGLGRLYMEKGRTIKALEYLREAEAYYISHSDEEHVFRVENLEFMSHVLDQQTRTRTYVALGLACLVLLLVAVQVLFRRNKILSLRQMGSDEAINVAAADLNSNAGADFDLTERDRQILALIAQGLTSAQIADKIYLSLPTIKWYRKRLLVKFDVGNTAEMISKAKEQGLI